MVGEGRVFLELGPCLTPGVSFPAEARAGVMPLGPVSDGISSVGFE